MLCSTFFRKVSANAWNEFHAAIVLVPSGAYPRGCRSGGPVSHEFWRLEQSGRMAPSPPRREFGAPELFFPGPGAPLGRPCLCLNGALFVMLLYLFLSFFLSFPLFSSLFLSLSFPFFLFGAPLGPQSPPRIRPDTCKRQKFIPN